MSVLDMIVIISFLLAIAVFFVFFSRKKATIYISTMNTYQDWTEDTPPPPYWISNSVKPGEKAYDTFGGELAEVMGVDNSDWGGQRRFLRLKLKVNALYNRRTNIYFLEDQPLLIGNQLVLNIGKSHFEGLISYVGETPEDTGTEYKTAEIKIFIPQVYPWEAVTYDKNFVTRNTQGDIIFQITSSKIVPALRYVNTSDGRALWVNDPYSKDVYITAKARVRCQEDTCYYNEVYPLRVGAKYKWRSAYSFIDSNSIIQDFTILDDNK